MKTCVIDVDRMDEIPQSSVILLLVSLSSFRFYGIINGDVELHTVLEGRILAGSMLWF